jgi:uncharacterized lipoprotein YbaY
MQKDSRNNTAFVRGRILISHATKAFNGGTAHVFLEDVSFADAPARIVAKTEIGSIVHQSNDSAAAETVVSFQIDFSDAAVDFKNHYSLRVWIDVDSDGKQSGDDLYSDQIYPVLTHGAGNFAEILLKPRD